MNILAQRHAIFDKRNRLLDLFSNTERKINNHDLNIDENCILVMRGCGPIGYPGAAEVVNMQPPDKLLKRGITSLPTLEITEFLLPSTF